MGAIRAARFVDGKSLPAGLNKVKNHRYDECPFDK
jgi:hypothetical protein